MAAQQSQTQQNSKWKTSASGNVYIPWDTPVAVKDDTGKLQTLQKLLQKQDAFEQKIGGVWYSVKNNEGSWLIFAMSEEKHAARAAKQSSGGGFGRKGGDAWYKIVDAQTTDTVEQFVYEITQGGWSPFGKTFQECTQVVNGKLVFGLVKREKVQPGGSQASGASEEPQESAPPV